MTDAEDARQIDALMAQFYRAFDNRQGRAPSLAEMCGLFCDKAVITQHREGACEFYTPSEFARPRVELLSNGTLKDFHEWEEDSLTHILGCVAARTSRYAKSGVLGDADYAGTGTKVFQLVKLSTGWYIVALSWFDDAPSDSRSA